MYVCYSQYESVWQIYNCGASFNKNVCTSCSQVVKLVEVYSSRTGRNSDLIGLWS